jgi:hypothetical protein
MRTGERASLAARLETALSDKQLLGIQGGNREVAWYLSLTFQQAALVQMPPHSVSYAVNSTSILNLQQIISNTQHCAFNQCCAGP